MRVYVVGKFYEGKVEKVGSYTNRARAEEAMLNAAYEINGRWVCIMTEEVDDGEKEVAK